MTHPDVQESLRSRGQMLLMLPILVSLLFCVPAVKACFKCNPEIKQVLQEYVKLSGIAGVETIITYGWASFGNILIETRSHFVDATTLHKIKTEYLYQLETYVNPPYNEDKAIRIVEKGKLILRKHLRDFGLTKRCPNTCGRLVRRLIDCSTCQYTLYTCPDGRLNCRDTNVQEEEGGQALLDCSTPWHDLVYEKIDYHFSWAPGVPGNGTLEESDFKPLVVTQDSFAILNQLHMEDQGTYRCSLQGRKGTVYYQVTFLVTVTPLPPQPVRPVLTLPVLPTKPPPDLDLTPILSMILFLTLTCCALLIHIIRLMARRRRIQKEE